MDKFICWVRESKILLQIIAVGFIVGGVAYLIFPPQTTSQFFDGSWPARTWGAAMIVGGVLDFIGLRTKFVDWSILGLAFLWAGTGSLALAQTMVMIAPPPTLTRGGGTALYWLLMIFVVSKLVVKVADKRDGRIAQEQMDDERD